MPLSTSKNKLLTRRSSVGQTGVVLLCVISSMEGSARSSNLADSGRPSGVGAVSVTVSYSRQISYRGN